MVVWSSCANTQSQTLQHRGNLSIFIELALRYASKEEEKNTALAFAMMDRGNIQNWFSSAGRIKCNQKGEDKSARETGGHRMPLLMLFCTLMSRKMQSWSSEHAVTFGLLRLSLEGKVFVLLLLSCANVAGSSSCILYEASLTDMIVCLGVILNVARNGNVCARVLACVQV